MKAKFENLPAEEKTLLMRAPVLVSFLAAASGDGVDEDEKAEAIRLSHLRTFTAVPLLRPFYREVEKIFKREFEILAEQYYPLGEAQKRAISDDLEKVNRILDRMDPGFAEAFRESLKSYARHVGGAHHNILEYFLFPFDVPGHPLK